MTFADMTPAQWAEYDAALIARHPEWTPDPMDNEADRPMLDEASGEESDRE